MEETKCEVCTCISFTKEEIKILKEIAQEKIKEKNTCE